MILRDFRFSKDVKIQSQSIPVKSYEQNALVKRIMSLSDELDEKERENEKLKSFEEYVPN